MTTPEVLEWRAEAAAALAVLWATAHVGAYYKTAEILAYQVAAGQTVRIETLEGAGRG
jgi:hypothetical protein